MAEAANELPRFATLENLKQLYSNLRSHISFEATCASGGDQQTKEIVLRGFDLVHGVRIIVNFINKNTAISPNLAIADGTDLSTKNYYTTGLPIVDSDGNTLTNGEQQSLSGRCELMLDRNNNKFILLSNRQRNIYVYSTTKPTNLLEGMIWLKPKTASSSS